MLIIWQTRGTWHWGFVVLKHILYVKNVFNTCAALAQIQHVVWILTRCFKTKPTLCPNSRSMCPTHFVCHSLNTSFVRVYESYKCGAYYKHIKHIKSTEWRLKMSCDIPPLTPPSDLKARVTIMLYSLKTIFLAAIVCTDNIHTGKHMFKRAHYFGRLTFSSRSNKWKLLRKWYWYMKIPMWLLTSCLSFTSVVCCLRSGTVFNFLVLLVWVWQCNYLSFFQADPKMCCVFKAVFPNHCAVTRRCAVEDDLLPPD